MAKLRRRARHRTANGSLDLFLRTRGSSEPAAKIAVGAKTTRTVTNDRARWPTLDHPAKAMMYLDTVSYLPDEMRVKVDRASMGVGLEVSSPLLDQQDVEFAESLPLQLRMDGHPYGKRILRQVLDCHLSPELTNRPKQGSSVPISAWLRGPMQDWADSLLGAHRLGHQGFLHVEMVRRI